MSDHDAHCNRHRTGKRSFQANLKPDENDLVNRVKVARGAATDRELLLMLCRDELDRIDRTVASA